MSIATERQRRSRSTSAARDHLRDGQAREAGRRRRRRPRRATRWCSPRRRAGRRRARARTSSRSPSTSRSGCTPPARSRAASSSARGAPTERAILTARMIDRPIRPLWPKGFRNEVQVICTILVGGHGHAARHPLHQRRLGGADALAAAVPRPGRRRAHRPDRRRARPQPDAARRSRSRRTLDLIVVGTKEALTMVEAGANEVPEETILEAFELAHEEIRKLCEAQEELRARRPASRSGSTSSSPRELEAQHGARDLASGSGSDGPARGRRGRRGARRRARPAAHDGLDRGRHRPRRCRCARRSTCVLEKQRLVAVERPGARAVRGRAARADRGRAGLEGAQVGQAAAALRPDHRRASSCRSRSAPPVEGAEPPDVKDTSRASR